MKTEYARLNAAVTKDGSEIRELMHPSAQVVRNQSLAEAIVHPGQTTRLHRHRRSEELYHVAAGTGRLTLGDETTPVKVGDTVCIPPGTAHCIENTGTEPLRILCACAPAYAHDDTELL